MSESFKNFLYIKKLSWFFFLTPGPAYPTLHILSICNILFLFKGWGSIFCAIELWNILSKNNSAYISLWIFGSSFSFSSFFSSFSSSFFSSSLFSSLFSSSSFPNSFGGDKSFLLSSLIILSFSSSNLSFILLFSFIISVWLCNIWSSFSFLFSFSFIFYFLFLFLLFFHYYVQF